MSSKKRDSRLFNFFAITGEADEDSVRILSLNQNLQRALSVKFWELYQEFMSYEEEVEFDGGYRPGSNEILVIPDFTLPEHVAETLGSTLGQDTLSESDLNDNSLRLKGIFGVPQGKAKSILVQGLTNGHRLTRSKVNMMLMGNTFTLIEHPGVIIQENLSAVYNRKNLYFRAFGKVKTFLDVSEFYTEATDQQIDDLFKKNPITVEDRGEFDAQTDSFIRKKIYGIVKKETLADFTPKLIKSTAQKYGISLTVKKVRNKDMITLPSDKKELKIALRFLDEDILESQLSSKVYVSNSKRIFPRS